MKTILLLLLTCGISYGGLSIYEKTEEVLFPHRNNPAEFMRHYELFIKDNPKQRVEILKAAILSFDLTKDQIVELVELTHKVGNPKSKPHRKRGGEKGGTEKGGGKEVLPTPPDPLDHIYRMPRLDPPTVYPPTVTPPSATSE